MAEDWLADVRKYAPDADENVVGTIVKYLGIALRNKDSSLVAFSDKTETDYVREKFLKKKLELTHDDATLDAAIAEVGQVMKGDRTKNRVTVYYLLSQHFGLLNVFGGLAGTGVAAAGAAALASLGDGDADKGDDGSIVAPLGAAALGAAGAVGAAASGAASKVGEVASDAVDAVGSVAKDAADSVGSAAAGAVGAVGAVGAAAVAALTPDPEPAKPHTAYSSVEDDNGGGGSWWPWLLFGLLAGALLYFGLKGCTNTKELSAPAAGADIEVSGTATPGDATVPATPAPAAPEGSGVIAAEREGKPMLTVYFDTGKSEVSNDLTTAAANVKTYFDANPTSTLAVSGFNDPTGNAAANAKLSKSRAENVKAALEKLGFAADRVSLEKPAETTGTGTTNAESRRVEVVIK